MTTPTRRWEQADADPVGAVTGWLAGHPDLVVEWRAIATGDGRFVGKVDAPPYPRLVIGDTDADQFGMRGLSEVRLTIAVLGDVDGRPGVAALRRFAMQVAEVLDEITTVPAVAGCVFSRVQIAGPSWSPIPPNERPRYLLTPTLRSRPVWTS